VTTFEQQPHQDLAVAITPVRAQESRRRKQGAQSLRGMTRTRRLQPSLGVNADGTNPALRNVMAIAPTRVRDIMTKDVVTLGHNDTLRTADDLMRLGRIRHLPVVDGDGLLAGIVTQRDLFHSGLLRALGYGAYAQQKALDSLVVKEAMRNDVVTTSPDTPLVEAAKIMFERKIGCLVVLEGDKIEGILTESDFVRAAAGI
jgi:CBS domain-containing protein